MSDLLERADVLDILERAVSVVPGIQLCALYGSYARGRATTESDVDVLVVSANRGAKEELTAELRRLRPDVADLVSISALRHGDLVAELRIRPSFITHLRDEGEVLSSAGPTDTSVTSILNSSVLPDNIRQEILWRTARVMRTVGDRRLNGHYRSALGRVYASAKGVCIAQLVAAGIPEYDWRRVFDTFAAVWPSLSGPAECLSSLRPFYDHARGTLSLPPVDHEAEELLTFEAIQCLKDVTVAPQI